MLEVICTIFFILVVIGLWIILYDTHHFVVRRYRFSSEKIKKPIRMVMLSDLHNYQYGRENSELLAAIDKAAPDMIVIAGDMITAAKKEKFDKTLTFLKALRDKYPVYYAYGNHEQKIELYKGTYGDMGERFAKGLREAGIEPLHNGHVMLPDSKAIKGSQMNIAKFADTGIAELVKQMERLGAQRSRMVAKIAGGANMFNFQGSNSFGQVGERNVEATKAKLNQLRIPILAADTGKNFGRTVIFYPETGDYIIRAVGKSEYKI